VKKERQTSHAVYDLKYPLIWINKYHKPIFFGDVAQPYKSLFEKLCKFMDIEIITGHVSKDYGRLCVQSSGGGPTVKVMGRITHPGGCWPRTVV